MDMTTERPTAVHVLHDGDKAYYGHHGRLVPCRVRHGMADGLVAVWAGKARIIDAKHLVHPDATHGHHFAGGPRILGRTVYMGAR